MMRLWMPLAVVLALVPPGGGEMERVQEWMQYAFYPVLLLVLVVASLGVPIPEDIPLTAAGILLRTHPDIASWPETLVVALVGVLTGDIVLYNLARRWGRGAVNHRWVRWIVTPERFTRFSRRFRVHGAWFCFMGRFVVGMRAAMCVTAGATRFAFWRFFLADLAGAALSVPLFLLLGYWFGGMIPTLQQYISGVQLAVLAVVLATLVVIGLVYRARRRRRRWIAPRGDVLPAVPADMVRPSEPTDRPCCASGPVKTVPPCEPVHPAR